MNVCRFPLAFFIAVLICFNTDGLWASNRDREYTLSGKTMGTFYSVKFITSETVSVSNWNKRVEMQLKHINKKMSMFDPKSELSLFNRHDIKQPIHISKDFLSILLTGKKMFKITDGAWDGTVKPLVDLWGFGTSKNGNRIPGKTEILKALSNTGYDHIVIQPPNTVLKDRNVTLDLGSIAKGYGVDKIAGIFLSSGIRNVLVEIGGELYAYGKNKKGSPWSIGINQPDKNYANQSLHTILRLKNKAIATSGDYRNFFKKNGRTYSHVINPQTGTPVKTSIVSASVVADNCTFADGLATALMVMPLKKGLALIDSLENTECLIITQEKGQFENHFSKNFNQFVLK